jgi:hypothetical protein
MKPSIGRIVHISFNGKIYPAIVTSVMPDDSLNLNVFNDAVIFFEGNAAPMIMIPSVYHGSGNMEWNWPPIVDVGKAVAGATTAPTKQSEK